VSDSEDDTLSRKRLHRRNIGLARHYALRVQKRLKAKTYRNGKKKRTRRNPDELLKESVDDGLFQREYRMSFESFHKLVDLLGDDIGVTVKTRDDCISPKSKLMMTLRFLAGASYVDICRIHGVSRSTVYKQVRLVIWAIAESNIIGVYEWPSDVDSCVKYANKWANKSGPDAYGGLHRQCIGALDGILIETLSPSRRDSKRPNDFRSGHKKRIGINVQAICDADLRFLLLSCKCPGKTNDWKAFKRSVISDLVSSLPPGYYILGDAAYINSEHLLVPYPGTNLPQREDAYNFYLSQLRIRIEMAFARLVGRWGIFWRPLRVPLRYQNELILAVCKLHNFCIDEKEEPAVPAYPDGVEAPGHSRSNSTGTFVTNRIWRTVFNVQSKVHDITVRDWIADLIQEFGLSRPASNRCRNATREI
jgi:DNA-directed RNA polymerase specialized sigma24 family protein